MGRHTSKSRGAGDAKKSKRSAATKDKGEPGKKASRTSTASGSKTAENDDRYRYKSYVVFVNDPKLKTPFTVLQSSNILCLESKEFINNSYLNDNRRRRQYDLAFTNLFAFPCRVFAKAANSVTPVTLHQLCDKLNQQFALLIACNVDVETAYTRLMQSNPRKVTDGVTYETGDLPEGDPASQMPLHDTASSYTDGANTQDVDDNESVKSKVF